MTKRTLKITLVFLMLVLALCCTLIACSGPAKTPEDEGGETPSTPVTIDLVVDGKSDYTIVYDDSDAEITEHVKAFVKKLSNDFFITIRAVGISEAEADYGHEIVIGEVRDCVKQVTSQMESVDFAMCVVEDDWVLCATGDRQYDYLFDVLMYDVAYTSRLRTGNLTLSADQNFFYHSSYYAKENYPEWLMGGKLIGDALIERIFTYESFTAKDGTTLPYRLFLPFEYDEDKEYPVLMILHGAGERGTDNKGNVFHMVPELFQTWGSLMSQAIIVCPQCPEGNQWVDTPWAEGNYSVYDVPISNELEAVMELLEALEDTYATDPDRYYVTGLSMGGFGTWDLLMRYPDVFAAGVPICGGGDPTYADVLCNIPIYTVHSKDDPSVPVAGTQAMVEAIKQYSKDLIHYSELKGKGHNVWDYAAKDEFIFFWLFEQNLSDR